MARRPGGYRTAQPGKRGPSGARGALGRAQKDGPEDLITIRLTTMLSSATMYATGSGGSRTLRRGWHMIRLTEAYQRFIAWYRTEGHSPHTVRWMQSECDAFTTYL